MQFRSRTNKARILIRWTSIDGGKREEYRVLRPGSTIEARQFVDLELYDSDKDDTVILLNGQPHALECKSAMEEPIPGNHCIARIQLAINSQ